LITPTMSSAGSAGVASAGSEDVESSSVPSADTRVVSGGDRGSPVTLVCPTSVAMSGAGCPETGVVPACSSHGATSVGEWPEDSAAEPMPDVLGGLCSSSKEDTEAVSRRVPPPSATVVLSLAPAADVGRSEAALAEEAPAARSSSSPPPTGPLAGEVRPLWPSSHDAAGTSAQRARQAALPGLFMSKLVWWTSLCLLSSPGSSLCVLRQVPILCTCCFAGDVMAGLLTPEERAAAAGARFGLGQPGLMAPGPSR